MRRVAAVERGLVWVRAVPSKGLMPVEPANALTIDSRASPPTRVRSLDRWRGVLGLGLKRAMDGSAVAEWRGEHFLQKRARLPSP
jgi:hypothetical protein